MRNTTFDLPLITSSENTCLLYMFRGRASNTARSIWAVVKFAARSGDVGRTSTVLAKRVFDRRTFCWRQRKPVTLGCSRITSLATFHTVSAGWVSSGVQPYLASTLALRLLLWVPSFLYTLLLSTVARISNFSLQFMPMSQALDVRPVTGFTRYSPHLPTPKPMSPRLGSVRSLRWSSTSRPRPPFPLTWKCISVGEDVGGEVGDAVGDSVCCSRRLRGFASWLCLSSTTLDVFARGWELDGGDSGRLCAAAAASARISRSTDLLVERASPAWCVPRCKPCTAGDDIVSRHPVAARCKKDHGGEAR
mmetsp:Transcript_39803/g.76089  ORF Transcript_39803/g.76089 Transcript_39803/m.76089 type:complete len:306 (+) Transcript_39803:673-1590(+)